MDTSRESCIAYIVQPALGDPCSLAVMDKENGTYHLFPISDSAMSRLALECAAKVHERITGKDLLKATQEAVRTLVAAK